MIFEMNRPDLGGDIAPRAGSFQSSSDAPIRLTTAAPRLMAATPGPASHEDLVFYNGRKIPKSKRTRNSAKAGASGRGQQSRMAAARARTSAFNDLDW